MDAGADVVGVGSEDAGRVLSDTLRGYMSDLAVDNGLRAVGFCDDDIPALVNATLPQVALACSQMCHRSHSRTGASKGTPVDAKCVTEILRGKNKDVRGAEFTFLFLGEISALY